MTPTERLLLLLARGTVESDAREDARALIGQGVEWHRLLQLSEAQGVAPLVARSLGALGVADVPDWARASLAASWRLNTARNLLVARALAQVLVGLGQVGIRAIPLKGVMLAESLYRDVGLRVCSDIDVLVPRPDVARAFAILRALGYRRADGEPEIEVQDLDLLLAGNIEYALIRAGSPECPLELHWDIAWRWPRDAAALGDLWAEARPRRAGGIEAWALSPEWEFLYLAIHAARHRWQMLKWLVDLHEVTVRGGIDWTRIRDKANRFGLEAVVDITLVACRALFGTPTPQAVAVGALPRWIQLFPAMPDSLDLWRGGVFPARLFSPWDRLSYVARLTFMPTLAERRLIRFPAMLRPLYYALRPLRLAAKWGAGAMQIGLRELWSAPVRASRR